MTIRLSKFVGRDQLPGDKAAFDRINRAFASANVQGPAAIKKVVRNRRARTINVVVAPLPRKAA